MRKLEILIVLMLAMSVVAAASTMLSGVQTAVSSLCSSLKQMLPVAAMLMIMVAGVIYAAGQIMGAETRARANVWATAALTGALIAILIAVVAPAVLTVINNGTVDC
ncbi:MAG: hypothetical protein NT051_00640 [Candidatus Micrarchaeota archaeon]|nr:hypothetical protein [Candidatus Micrarchaeota archaeon]